MRNLFKIGIVSLLLLGAAGIYFVRSGWNGEDDLRLGVLAGDRVGIVAVSPKRRMINVAGTLEESRLWVPDGWGWYEADKVKKISDQSKDSRLFGKILFYNFGFIPKYQIKVNKFDEWNSDWVLFDALGWVDFLKYKWLARGMLFNSQNIGGIDEPRTNEILLRDYSDNSLLSRDIRVTVINSTQNSGFAQFIGQRLEWLGISVLGVENSKEEVDNCIVAVNNKADFEMPEVGMMKKLWNCELRVETGVAKGEIYLNLGDELAEMLKYSSYK